MCESENLIMTVEKYPCIWDINNPDYHNRDIKDLAWEQICKELFNDWETCTNKANKCAELKKKWTNIRDYYRKELQKNKNIPTGSAAKKPKKYVYGELLYFLTPIFSKRDSQGNYLNEHSNSNQPQLQSENEEQIIEPDDVNRIEPPVLIPPVVKNIQKKNKDIPTQILNMLQQNQKNTAVSSNTVEDDDDTKFLLSFRSYMKKMNADQKIDFQLGMLQLVKKINMRNYPSSSQSSPQLYSDSNNNSSLSFPSPHSIHSSYTPIPQSSPLYYSISSPTSTYVPSLQQNKYVPLPQSSPVRFSPSPSANSSFQQQSVSCTSTSKPRIVIHSITNVEPANTQQNPEQELPEYHIPDDNFESTEDNESPQFLVLQSQKTQDDDSSVQNYFKFK